MAYPKLVYTTTQTLSRQPSNNSSQEQLTQDANNSEAASFMQETESDSMSLMRRIYQNRGFSQQATNIILNSWRDSSHKQYGTYISKWILFCTKRKIDPVSPSINMAVEFFTKLYQLGLSYSSINTARCALSAI